LDFGGVGGIIGTTDLMSQPPQLWIGLVELKPLNREEYGAAGAFTNIITWACNAVEFRKKAETIAGTMNLYVIGVEGEEPLSERTDRTAVSEDLEDMIQRAESNPDAIVYGTFHCYTHDEA
jgi:hypothetical protein